ncbi:hypothetical protein Ssi03_77250 [Sphaerisporangium siamense]|nr:hypothetical protein Ssi03_77250 [Sphaerisporangium siamense]
MGRGDMGGRKHSRMRVIFAAIWLITGIFAACCENESTAREAAVPSRDVGAPHPGSEEGGGWG